MAVNHAGRSVSESSSPATTMLAPSVSSTGTDDGSVRLRSTVLQVKLEEEDEGGGGGGSLKKKKKKKMKKKKKKKN